MKDPIIKITIIGICLLLAAMVAWYLLTASADNDGSDFTWEDYDAGRLSWDDNDVEVGEEVQMAVSEDSNFMSFFRLKQRNHVIEPDQMNVRVKVNKPTTPGVLRATVRMIVKINGISVAYAPSLVQWEASPDHQIDRQDTANEEAEAFIWNLLSNTEVSWLSNPQERDGFMWVDVFYYQGGVVCSLAETMIETGHAMPKVEGKEYDWTLRRVRLKD